MSSYFWLNINPRKKCRRKPAYDVIDYDVIDNESLMTSSDNQGKGERYDWLWMNMSSHVFFTINPRSNTIMTSHNYDVTQLWRHVGKFGQLHRNSKGCKMWNISVHTVWCPKIFQIKHPKALGRIYFSTSNLHLRPLDPKNKIRIWVGFEK